MSDWNNPEFDEKIEVKLAEVKGSSSVESPSCELTEDSPSVQTSSVCVSEDSASLPLFLCDLWAYWVLFALSAILVVGSGYFCIVAPHFLRLLALLFVFGLIVLSRLLRHIRWRIAAGEAVKAGCHRSAEVVVIKYPAGYAAAGPALHILVDNKVLLPVSSTSNLKIPNLQELLSEPVVSKKVFLLKDSDLPVAVAIGKTYLLVAEPNVNSVIDSVLKFALLAIFLLTLR